MERFAIWIDGEWVEHVSTERACELSGMAYSTIFSPTHKDNLQPVAIGRQFWWPLDVVKAYDPRKADGRYK